MTDFVPADPDVWDPFAAAPPPPRPVLHDPSVDQVTVENGVTAWIAPLLAAKKAPSFRPTLTRNRTCPIQKQLLTVGGFAGTGKTTLTGVMAWRWINDNGLRVAFATYTGKASTVLARALKRAGVSPEYVGTIHRLVYVPDTDENGRIRGWKKAEDLPFDLIVIDEASMVPTTVINDLLAFKIPILAIGDHGQLPPVADDTGGIMAAPDLTLTKIHRQAAGNPIIALAAAVREGASIRKILAAVEQANDPRVRGIGGRAGLIEAIKFTADPQNSFLIAYTNETRQMLNTIARKVRGLNVEEDEEDPPVKGEAIICLRNNYNDGQLEIIPREERSGRIIANGMRGIIVSDVEQKQLQEQWHTCDVEFDDGVVNTVDMLGPQFGRPTFKDYVEIRNAGGPRVYSWDQVGMLADFGYALTCHKSQGSQAERVVVYLESKLQYMKDDERKKWLYTAITRSSSDLLLVSP